MILASFMCLLVL